MSQKENYINFYENIDRDKVYSSQNDMQQHPMTDSLKEWLNQYNLNDKKNIGNRVWEWTISRYCSRLYWD